MLDESVMLPLDACYFDVACEDWLLAMVIQVSISFQFLS